MIDKNNFPYKEIRKDQEMIIDKLNKNFDKFDYFILECPTGMGKSAIAKTIACSMPSYILTATKQLQNQYMADYHSKIRSIKGKSNYNCKLDEAYTCDSGLCSGNSPVMMDCVKNRICTYFNKKRNAMWSYSTLTSYQFFLSSISKAKAWNVRNMIIVDECHLLEQQLIQSFGFKINPKELREKYDLKEFCDFKDFLRLIVTPSESGFEKNKELFDFLFNLLKIKRDRIILESSKTFGINKINNLTDEEKESLLETNKDFYNIDMLCGKLNLFNESSDKDEWIIEPEDGGLTFKPINVGKLFAKYVKNKGKKVLFMSATILDINGFCQEFDLPRKKVGVIRLDSTFDPKKSPIIFDPVGYMNYDKIESTTPKIINKIKEILENHKDEKGIIHTNNYKITQRIVESLNNKRLLMRQENETNEELVDRHVKSKLPTVLISPSLNTGTDLKDNLSRFQVIIKLPFQSIADQRIAKKMKLNFNWYVAEMFRSLVQACGRSTRSENDFSVTYILDSSFHKWIFKYKSWFPKQFLQRIKYKSK